MTFIIPLNFCIGPFLWKFGLLIIDPVISSLEHPIPAALSLFVANADKFQYAPELLALCAGNSPVTVMVSQSSSSWDAAPLIRYLSSLTFGCINEVKPFLPQHKETWSAKFIRIYGADFDTNRPSNPNEIVPVFGCHALVFVAYKYLTPGINSLNWTWY